MVPFIYNEQKALIKQLILFVVKPDTLEKYKNSH